MHAVISNSQTYWSHEPSWISKLCLSDGLAMIITITHQLKAAVFRRVSKGLKKTSPKWSRSVHINWFFCALDISKIKILDLQSGLLRSWSSLVMVFFQLQTRLPNTKDTQEHTIWSKIKRDMN